MSLTPMFGKTKLFTLDDYEKMAKRKTRSDKKYQIKIPVTDEQKLTIGRLSIENGHSGELHSFLADVLKRAMERDYIIHSRPVEYHDTKNYASTKVRKDVYDKIAYLRVEWGLRSVRQTAHRIIINELMG